MLEVAEMSALECVGKYTVLLVVLVQENQPFGSALVKSVTQLAGNAHHSGCSKKLFLFAGSIGQHLLHLMLNQLEG